MELSPFQPPAWDELDEWIDAENDTVDDDALLALALEHTDPELASSYPTRIRRNNVPFLTLVVQRAHAHSPHVRTLRAKPSEPNGTQALWFVHRFGQSTDVRPTIHHLVHPDDDTYWERASNNYASLLTDHNGQAYRMKLQSIEGGPIEQIVWHSETLASSHTERGTLVWWDDASMLEKARHQIANVFTRAGFQVVHVRTSSDITFTNAVMHYRAALAYTHLVELPDNAVWCLLREQTMDDVVVSFIRRSIAGVDNALHTLERLFEHFEIISTAFFNIEVPCACLVHDIRSIFDPNALDDSVFAFEDPIPSIDRIYELFGLMTKFERPSGVCSKLVGLSTDPFSNRYQSIRLAMLCGVASAFPDFDDERYLDADDDTLRLAWTNRVSRVHYDAPKPAETLALETYKNQVRESSDNVDYIEACAIAHYIRKAFKSSAHVVCVDTREAKSNTIRAFLSCGWTDASLALETTGTHSFTSIDSLDDVTTHPSCRVFLIHGIDVSVLGSMRDWHVHVMGARNAAHSVSARERAVRGVFGAHVHTWHYEIKDGIKEPKTRLDELKRIVNEAARASSDAWMHMRTLVESCAIESDSNRVIVQAHEHVRIDASNTSPGSDHPSHGSTQSRFSIEHNSLYTSLLLSLDTFMNAVPRGTIVHVHGGGAV